MREEANLDQHICKDGIKYLGTATLQENGRYRVLAIVGEALCIVEVSINTPEEKLIKANVHPVKKIDEHD